MDSESKHELSQIGCMFTAMLWVMGLFIAGYTGYFVAYCLASMLIATILVVSALMINKE